MTAFVALATRARTRLVAALVVASAALAALPAPSSGAGPGTFTQADVNAAIAKGVGYFDANQNSDGSWGTSFKGAETALALASYGVLDSGSFANLSAGQQTRVQNGLSFLLSTQGPDGSFNQDGLKTYDTGLALIALSLSSDVPTTPAGAVATAIANGRAYLINNQNIPPNGGGLSCQTTGTLGSGLGGQNYCGGWDYNTADARSDESNTGFGLTGLDVTGGVPAAVAAANAGWQRNVQQLTSNPGGFTARNDGGGAYEPGISSGSFSSNANDTGSLLFGFGYDSVPATDPAVQAAIKFGSDVFDTYELNKATRTMVYHTGMNEDGSCVIGVGSCDWAFGSFEGGYHYSIFALVKGLGQYITPNLSDPTNFYAKAVDLLLTEQNTDGSWPADLRDDGSILGATGFAILALGRVGTPESPITAAPTTVSATEGQSFTGNVATFTDPDTKAAASEYSATITWGDGSTSTGTVSGSGGSFTVSGAHTYAEEGPSTATVTITDTDNTSNTSSASSAGTVADATLSATGTTVTPVEGNSSSQTVATFTDANPGGTISDYTATINWGDGQTTAGTLSASGSGFKVSGSHAYAEEGSNKVTVSIKDVGGSTASATSTAKVSDAQLSAKGKRKLTAKTGRFNGTVATFTDKDPGGTRSDYTATINWGDGSTTSGTITGSGIFLVHGSHRYHKSGSFHVKVTIKDRGGSTATARTTITVPAPARAKLSGVPSGCTLGSFTATVRGTRISRVTFRLDGKKISRTTVHRGTVYRATVTEPPGTHHLTVNVTFLRSTLARARTFRRTVSSCVGVPRFTG